MDFTLCKVTFGQVDMYHCQRALVSAVHIPFHASKVEWVQISEFFYYYNKYLNSVKCREISMGPFKCAIQFRIEICNVRRRLTALHQWNKHFFII
jgi:hypothetical protein